MPYALPKSHGIALKMAAFTTGDWGYKINYRLPSVDTVGLSVARRLRLKSFAVVLKQYRAAAELDNRCAVAIRCNSAYSASFT